MSFSLKGKEFTPNGANSFIYENTINDISGKVKVSHSLVVERLLGVEARCILAQNIKSGVHISPFAVLSFPDSKQIPIYCWGDRERFPIVGWPNSVSNFRPSGDFVQDHRVDLPTRPRKKDQKIKK